MVPPGTAVSSQLGPRSSAVYRTRHRSHVPRPRAAETGRGRAQTSLYGECETAAKVHSRFCGFFRAPELPASSSHHTRAHGYTGTRGVMYTAVHGIQRDRALCMLLPRSLLLLLLPRLLLLLPPPPRLLLRCCCRCWSTRRTGRAHLRARPQLSVVRGSNPHAPSAVGAARAAAAADRQRRLQRRRGRWPRAGC